MKTLSAVKVGLGGGAALLLAGFLAAPAAQAGGGKTVPCSTGKLVAAITAANAAGGGVINLTPWCHYALTTAVSGEDGLPPVTARIAVNGNGATIDGTGAVRVFEVDGPGGNLWLNNVTITGGSADNGGGIANLGGTVTLNFSTVTRNTATDAGGGIAIATGLGPPGVAKLTLNFSRVTDNRQTAGPASQNSLGGGGILSILGKVTLNASQVSGNTAMGFVGGGIASGDLHQLLLDQQFPDPELQPGDRQHRPERRRGRHPESAGHGHRQQQPGERQHLLERGRHLQRAWQRRRTAAARPSHLTLNNSQVNGNTATAPVPQPGPMSGPPIAAGGIANGGVAVLNNTQVNNNTASHTSGGGIVNHGTMTLKNSQVNRNTAAGSGIVASGGGIISAQGMPGSPPTTLTLINSLVAFNRAGGDGGGIANGVPLPSPPPLIGGTLKLVNSLVIGNRAAAGEASSTTSARWPWCTR